MVSLFLFLAGGDTGRGQNLDHDAAIKSHLILATPSMPDSDWGNDQTLSPSITGAMSCMPLIPWGLVTLKAGTQQVSELNPTS